MALVTLRQASVFLDDRPVLHRLDWRICGGECWVVHGPNGAGKSTLLGALWGDHRIALGGKIERHSAADAQPLEAFRQRVGFVSGELQARYPRAAQVRDVVLSGAQASFNLARKATVGEMRRAERCLAAVGLRRSAARELKLLSYGQQRRVLLARALMADPVLLMLDEPYAGLDVQSRRQLSATVATLATPGRALVMVLHHRDEWPPFVTHELELARGRARYCGTVRA